MDKQQECRIVLEVSIEHRATIKARAAIRNISMKRWILDAISEKIKQELKYE